MNPSKTEYSCLLPFAAVPTNQLQAQALEVRTHHIAWQSYLNSGILQPEEYDMMREYELAQTSEAKSNLLIEKGKKCAKTFISLMTKLSQEQTIQYILTIIDDLLTEDAKHANIFFSQDPSQHNSSAWSSFIHFLNWNDNFVVHQASRIISKLACQGNERMKSDDLIFYLNWIKIQLSTEKIQFFEMCVGKDPEELLQTVATDFVRSVLASLSSMLRVREYRSAFMKIDGLTSVIALLNVKCGFQVQYQAILCIWMMSFSPDICLKISRYNPIPILADILGEAGKEKVTRIILATFRNLVTKTEDSDVVKMLSLAMIHCKVLKNIEIFEIQHFKDKDVSDDVEFLGDHLRKCLQDVSSFDEYSSELKSRRLEWSPVHKSQSFWRENAARLNEKNYELLKILTDLLKTSNDAEVLSVALYDIGEYVRHYTRGKRVINEFGIKKLIMELLSHSDASVKYNALIAVQKLMVHNWEYLGKQITCVE